MKCTSLLISVFIVLFILFGFIPPPKSHAYVCANPQYCPQVQPGQTITVAHCLAFQHFDTATQQYIYAQMECRINKGVAPLCNPDTYCRSIEQQPSSYFNGAQMSQNPLNTNVFYDVPGGLWDPNLCGSIPQTCDQGFNTSESCSAYIGNPSCSGIPCACRPNYYYGGNCQYSCSGNDGGGGGGPTSTPTPTPSPYCNLLCPGQESQKQTLHGGGSVPDVSVQPTPILPTQASGFIDFFGYNNFICNTFDDAKGYIIACPTSTGGGLGYGLTSQWTYPTPTTNPIRFNMLCGGNDHTYTAVAASGSRSGGPGGSPTPTLGLYPPNCSLGGPTPTPDPNNLGDSQVGGARSAGTGSASGANSCSCSVRVGCQASLQSLPSETGSTFCTPECDFAVSPQTPEYSEQVTFTPSGSGANGSSTFTFDDNTAAVSGQSVTTHTFANAGVYKVALDCPSIGFTCTRDVNVYCGPISWYKLKDTSFHKNGNLNDPIPAAINAYDADDTTQALVSIGNAGLVTTTGSITTGSGNLSTPNWRTTVYSPNSTYTPTAFADYVLARKSYVTITDSNSNGIIDSNEVTSNATNYIVGNYTIDSNSIQSNAPLLLVVRGDLILNTTGAEFNPPDKAMTFVVTGMLKIHSHHDTLNGIFMATNVDLAYDVSNTTTPLKIKGNLVSQNSVDLKKRIRTDGSKPSFFIMQDYKQVLKILDKVGIRRYTQTELRP